MKNLLNSSQRISLQVSLRNFEERLRYAEHILDHPVEEEAILFRQHLDLPEEYRAGIKSQIKSALDQIRELREVFSLEVDEDDLARRIESELYISWENLMDVHAIKLRGYGEVHPGLAGILDPRIQNLAAIALELASWFRDAKS